MVGAEKDVTNLIGGVEELAPSQSVTSMWLRKTGDEKVSNGRLVHISFFAAACSTFEVTHHLKT
jgi:hypothetical protein